MGTAPIIFLIAGEPSGDRLGASLMAGLKTLAPGTVFHGIGGPLMQAEGLVSLFPMGELSIMGLAEIVPKLPALLRRIRQVAATVVRLKPDALITIDSPDFCLRVARKVKAVTPGQKIVHYVAPTVWAWRPGRAVKMARSVDHVLALFPFEPPLMQAAGMTCDFVGHPIAAEPKPGPQEIAAFRAQYDLAASERMIVVLPGSRLGEITRMGPIFRSALAQILQQHPALRYVVPVTRNVEQAFLETLDLWPGKPIVLLQSANNAAKAERLKWAAFAAADLALAASGTVSLELAATETPMVIAYRFNWMTTQIIKRKVHLKSATLINILTDSLVVPEFLFENCTADKVAACVLALLYDADLHNAQVEAARKSIEMLQSGIETPGLRAARSVLEFLRR